MLNKTKGKARPLSALQKALDCSREDAVRYILHIALHTKSEEVQDA